MSTRRNFLIAAGAATGLVAGGSLLFHEAGKRGKVNGVTRKLSEPAENVESEIEGLENERLVPEGTHVDWNVGITDSSQEGWDVGINYKVPVDDNYDDESLKEVLDRDYVVDAGRKILGSMATNLIPYSDEADLEELQFGFVDSEGNTLSYSTRVDSILEATVGGRSSSEYFEDTYQDLMELDSE